MTIQANSSGVVSGRFTVPANVRAGTKSVVVNGQGGSRGEAVFVGGGDTQTVVRQRQTTIVNIYGSRDPLAETFTLADKAQLAGVDLWVDAMGDTPIVVQIRETEVGFPVATCLAEARKAHADVTVGAFNRFLFAAPVTLNPSQEYALVVLSGDATTTVGVAELGKWDLTNSAWVTSQPYQIGVLLSSSNAVTWTAHQDRDLTFRLLRNTYTQATRTIDLGTVAVTGATDLMVLGVADIPDESTRIEYRLTLPDARVITVSSDQPLRLSAPITGDVAVEAILHGSADFSPVLFPETSLVHGVIATSGTYISRAMEAGINSRVHVVYQALLPAGSTVTVEASGVDLGDSYVAVPLIGTKNMDNGWIEFTHELADIDENMVRVRLTLAGSAAARPYVSDIRCMVM
jgi:hypothetical protein